MDEDLRQLERSWLCSGDDQARERYYVELERRGDLRRVELPWVAEVTQLRARLERLRPEDLWLDPFADNEVDWKPPQMARRVVGRTPHASGSVRVPSHAAWLVRPLRGADELRVLAAAAAGVLAGLALDLAQYDLQALAGLESQELRVLELRGDCRVLEPALLGRLPNLTHLTLQGVDQGWLEALAQLEGLEHLELKDAELSDLTPLGALKGLRSLHLTKCRLPGGQLDSLGELGLESLGLFGCKGLTCGDLDELPLSLRELDLGWLSVEGETQPQLERLEALELLDLSCADFQSEGLLGRLPRSLTNLGLVAVPLESTLDLARLTSLRRLDLSQGLVSPQRLDLQPLAALRSLRELTLKNTWVEDEDLAPLAELRELRSLNLQNSPQLTGVGLRHVRGAPALTRIRMFGCYGLTPAGAAALAELPALEELSLAQAVNLYGAEGLSDECLGPLAGATKLERLDLSANRISSQPLAELRARLKGCRILAGSRMHPLEVVRAINSARGQDDTVAALESLAERWPDSAPLAEARADAAAALGDGVAAVDHLGRFVELEPEAGSYQQRGWVLWKTGRCAEAVADFSRALELDPSMHEIYEWRARAHLQAGEHLDGISDYTRLIELGSEGQLSSAMWASAAQLYGARSWAHCQAADYEAARADAERAIATAPEQAAGYVSLAQALAKLGRRDEAVTQFRLVLERAPDHDQARRGLLELGEQA